MAGRKHIAHHREKESRHVRLYHWFLNSRAWLSLNCVERSIYLEIESRYAGVGSNNGRIGYSVREAATNLHIGKSTAGRALETLQERGFIVAMKRGAFSLKIRNSTEWLLTMHASDLTATYSQPIRSFMSWPEKQNTVPNRTSTVPITGPIGTHSGTGIIKTPLNGTCSGTVSAA